MSEVERLRASVIAECYAIDPEEPVDALIAAVREDERKKIRNKAECLQRNFDARESKYFYGERQDNGDIDVIATEDCYILPASVLAPKEGTITNH